MMKAYRAYMVLKGLDENCSDYIELASSLVGDTVIIISYALMDFEEAKTFQPKVVFPHNNHLA